MLPPRTTGWPGSAARIAAVSEAVVVLPFVPVTPIVGAMHSRRNRSGSDTSAGADRSPAARAATSVASAARRRGSVVGNVGVDRRRRRHESRRRPTSPPDRPPARARAAPADPRAPRSHLARSGSRPAVVDGDPGAGIGQEAGQRDAAPGETEHRHRDVGEQPVADRLDGERVGVDRQRSWSSPPRSEEPARLGRQEQRHPEERGQDARRSRSGS